MNSGINVVIIDTSAYVREQCDFLGLNSSILPSLFELLSSKGISLLSHPILVEEIKKHINCSSIIERLDHAKASLSKYKNILNLIDISVEDSISKIDSLKLASQMVDAFERFYIEATVLSYPNPATVFAQYFSGSPPFTESRDKKHEFPDAFVIEAIRQFLAVHPESSILIISDDSDWVKAMINMQRAFLADSIVQGIKFLQSSENIVPIFDAVKYELGEQICQLAECESFEISGFELIDDVEIDSIEVDEISDDIVPLKISESSILVRAYATLIISGRGTVLDESHSYWDNEDMKYIIAEYNDISFNNGSAEVECELSVTFDPSDPIDSASIDSVKLNVKYNIQVNVDETIIVYSNHEQDPRE